MLQNLKTSLRLNPKKFYKVKKFRLPKHTYTHTHTHTHTHTQRQIDDLKSFDLKSTTMNSKANL